MNFNDWYNQYNPRFLPAPKKIAADAWQGCKDEILKILEKNTTEYEGPHGTGREELNVDCIEEIKRL